jgi:hypothetical protein
MAYEGYQVPIVLGQLGLQTDAAQSQLAPNGAITANNVAFWTGVVSKSNGTARYSSVALGSAIVCGIDYWATASSQRMVVATAAGNIYKDNGSGTFASGTPLAINDTQWIKFSSTVTGGFVQWKWNGNASTGYNLGGVDTAAQVQTQLRTISGLSTVSVSGDWVNGFTVYFTSTSSTQPLITTNIDGLLGTGYGSSTTTPGVAQWMQFSTPVTGGTVTWQYNGAVTTGTNAGGTDTAAAVQSNLRTISALNTIGVTVVGNWTQGFVVNFPGVYSAEPFISPCLTQTISFTSVPVSGSVTWSYAGTAATSANTPADSTATVQAVMRTIPALASVLVSGSWSTGFTVLMPGISATTVISNTTDTLLNSSSGAVGISYVTVGLTGASTVVFSSTQAQLENVTVTHIIQGTTTLGGLDTNAHMVTGGNEVPNNARRLFIYSNGTSQLAMITGDSTAVTGITRPAADWTSTYPTFGLIFQGRHFAILQHTLYISKLSDHTDFTTTATDGTGAATFPIFPGEGDGIIGATVFKGALLIFKKPYGMYLFQWNGSDLATAGNVSVSKVSDNFALASPHAVMQVLNDLIGGSSTGSLFSQNATNAFGALEAGDVLTRAQVRNYFRQNFDYSGWPKQGSAYYAEKFLGMFTGSTDQAAGNNRILMYDAAATNPRISVETKDNPNCLWLRKDSNTVPRPFYGATDGYVYQMDQSGWSVNGTAYTGEFQTPYIDFSFLDPKFADKVKLFDFLSVTYQPVGTWPFYVDVYVDGKFIQTVTFNMQQTAAVLGSFILDVSTLGAPTTALELRQPLKSCAGKSISFRIYNSNLNQSFTVERLTISFRESGEQNRSSK